MKCQPVNFIVYWFKDRWESLNTKNELIKVIDVFICHYISSTTVYLLLQFNIYRYLPVAIKTSLVLLCIFETSVLVNVCQHNIFWYNEIKIPLLLNCESSKYIAKLFPSLYIENKGKELENNQDVKFRSLISECLPDGTVKVENPNVGVYSHVFAVQDEGVSAAVKCTVATSGAQSNITGCSQVIADWCRTQRNLQNKSTLDLLPPWIIKNYVCIDCTAKKSVHETERCKLQSSPFEDRKKVTDPFSQYS